MTRLRTEPNVGGNDQAAASQERGMSRLRTGPNLGGNARGARNAA